MATRTVQNIRALTRSVMSKRRVRTGSGGSESPYGVFSRRFCWFKWNPVGNISMTTWRHHMMFPVGSGLDFD